MTTRVVVNGDPLTPQAVVAAARGGAVVTVDHSIWERMAPARDIVERAVAEDQVVYGITTGLGKLASTRVEPAEAEELQVNLLRSHAAGVGEPLPDEMVRAMLLLRARTLAQGYSGVRPVVVERLIQMLDLGILPVVPAQGSVGASGDLAPFAHLALPLIGEGEVREEGRIRPAGEALADHGLAPIHLRAKEGLSLLNGTEGMLAFGVLGLDRAQRLTRIADAACALSVEALLGSARPFRTEVHRLRPHPGQRRSAELIARLLEGSEIGSSHAEDFVHAVQDAYCLRCAPQVHGAVWDTLDHCRRVFEIELGAVVDNPIVLPESGEVVSAGNFHGQPLAFALDFMTIAVAELSSISERRTDRMLDPQHSSGLPAFLSPRPGLHSGYMLAQYTAAALVAENRVLSHPASVESIPTSGSQEDHVSMGWGAGRKLWDVLANATRVVAVELLCAVQGIEERAPLRPASGTAELCRILRTEVPTLTSDRQISKEIEAVAQMIDAGRFDPVLGPEEM